MADSFLSRTIHGLRAVFEISRLFSLSRPMGGLLKVKTRSGITQQHPHNKSLF